MVALEAVILLNKMPKYNNHLSKGHKVSTFKEKKVASSLNSRNFEASINLLNLQTGAIGVIPPGYEHRADKIADLFYGSPTLDWVVLWTNNISDPFEQLNVGDRIKIVSLS